MRRLLVLGAGGHGKVVADAASAGRRWAVIEFLDDRYPEHAVLEDWKVVARSADIAGVIAADDEVIVAIGDNARRLAVIDELLSRGISPATVTHPAAVVSPRASLAPGCVVFAGAVINAGASLGRGCIVNTGAIVDHDCRLDDAVHVAPGAALGGNVRVGRRSWVGIGASVRHGISIGSDTMIGAGAAVVADIGDNVVAVGVPARVSARRGPDGAAE
jgi:sugar O-acyltransferase (sialic acid O-acetyltransferase NeuD family)